MTKLFETVNAGRAPFDPGTYVATLLNIEPYKHDQYGPGLTWKFALSPDLANPDDFIVNETNEEEISELWSITSTRMSPTAKARKYVEALLARKLNIGEDIELEDLKDKRMTVQVTTSEGNDGKMYAKIAGQSPYTGAPKPLRTRTRRPVVEEQVEESDDDQLPF
jgi:hypothetical protein